MDDDEPPPGLAAPLPPHLLARAPGPDASGAPALTSGTAVLGTAVAGPRLGPGAILLASAVTSWTGAAPSPLAWNGPVPDDDEADDDDLFRDVDIELLLPGLRSARPGAAPDRTAGAVPPRVEVSARRGPAPSSGRAATLSAKERERRAARIREHVVRRMRGVPEQESRRVSDVILEAAAWARLDPVLILAIIEVESAFELTARSNRDARGLMQVRPATLWREAERAGLTGDDPYEPGLNVRAGALYFRRLVDAFGLNDVALMAYNAGPNRILGHLRAGGIPERYLEYPRRVRAAEARLRALLAAEPPAKLAARDSPLRAQRQD
jgi:hypothetical protein